MKKPYDKYVTKTAFFTIIGIVFVLLASAMDDKFSAGLVLLASFIYLGAAFYCMAKERKGGD